MTNQTNVPNSQHIAHAFDNELDHLHNQLLEMVDLIMSQLDHAMHALDNGNVNQAIKVITRNKKVKKCEIKIDKDILAILARRNPVANDLRTIVATSKIVAELEKTGNELADFARLITVLYDPNSSDPNQHLLTDIIKIGKLVKLMLGRLRIVLETKNTNDAYVLLHGDRDCEIELQEGIKHQLFLVVQNVRMIRRGLDIMQMMKSLELCGEHCRNIAEYLIFMLDGKDVRHNYYPEKSIHNL